MKAMAQYDLKINNNGYKVEILSVKGNIAEVTVNGTPYQVEIGEKPAGTATVTAPVRPVPSAAGNTPAATAAAAPAATGKAVESPLDGNIISINVAPGDIVKQGQTIAVLEAMKMENEIQSEYDGIVTAVNTSKGEHVSLGFPIITIG